MFKMNFRARPCSIRERKLEIAQRRGRRPIDGVLDQVLEPEMDTKVSPEKVRENRTFTRLHALLSK